MRTSPPAPRGVTLLELLVVLTLMGITAALVAPAVAARSVKPEAASVTLVSLARRTAIRRAERLSLRLGGDGAWSVRTVSSGLVVDSGHVRDSLPDAELLLDALGGCVPAPSERPTTSFDPLNCSFASRGALP